MRFGKGFAKGRLSRRPSAGVLNRARSGGRIKPNINVPASALVWSVAGSSPVLRATLRVTFWGALAMTLTGGVGALFGAVV